MSNGVIVVSHANLASGVYSAIEMVAGSFDNVRIQEFKNNDSLEAFDQRLKDDYQQLKQNHKYIFVLADLAGGTPFNRAVLSLGNYENVRVIGGLNFASLYQAINSDGDDIDLCVDDIINTAKDSIVLFENKSSDDEESFEDGI